jgi:hypothetical protein
MSAIKTQSPKVTRIVMKCTIPGKRAIIAPSSEDKCGVNGKTDVRRSYTFMEQREPGNAKPAEPISGDDRFSQAHSIPSVSVLYNDQAHHSNVQTVRDPQQDLAVASRRSASR